MRTFPLGDTGGMTLPPHVPNRWCDALGCIVIMPSVNIGVGVGVGVGTGVGAGVGAGAGVGGVYVGSDCCFRTTSNFTIPI